MKITVIIPTFNAEQTIHRAINSILRQDAKGVEYEILVCDDCSTDNTLSIISALPIKVIKNVKHTGGPNAGRNAGIKAAIGDYIAFLDQDDEWTISKIANQIKEINNGYEFIYSSCTYRQE